MKRDLSMSAAARALQSMGKLEVIHVTDAPRVKSLREACLERGINPDATGYKVPQNRFLAVERIIPGVPDRISPCEQLRQRGHMRPENARRMYTRQSAANDAAQVAEGGVEAYVAAFCRLNNLKGA